MIDAAIAIDAEAIPLEHGVKSGAWSEPFGGKWIPGELAWSNIRGVLQPARGTQLRDLPEGLRDEALWILWTRAAVLLDDLIKDGAISCRVMFLWPRREGGFTRAAIGLLK